MNAELMEKATGEVRLRAYKVLTEKGYHDVAEAVLRVAIEACAAVVQEQYNACSDEEGLQRLTEAESKIRALLTDAGATDAQPDAS